MVSRSGWTEGLLPGCSLWQWLYVKAASSSAAATLTSTWAAAGCAAWHVHIRQAFADYGGHVHLPLCALGWLHRRLLLHSGLLLQVPCSRNGGAREEAVLLLDRRSAHTPVEVQEALEACAPVGKPQLSAPCTLQV